MNIYKYFQIFAYVYLIITSISAEKLNRRKRDLGTIISIIAEVGPPIYGIIRESLKKKSCGKKISPDMVNNHYNNNMANSEKLKNDVVAKMAQAGEAIHMNPNGYYCNQNYCDEMGPNIKGTLGICSKKYCLCNNGVGSVQECGRKKVFDPMTNSCKYTSSAILCH